MKIKGIAIIAVIALMINGFTNAENRFEEQIKSKEDINLNTKVVGSSISLITELYIPGTTVDLQFYYTYLSPDGEWDDGVSLDFPDGVFVNSASGCTTTGYQQLPYNGETGDGALVTWGSIEGGSGLGGLKSSGQFSVNVTISEGYLGTLSIDWYIAGDGFGAQPNFNSGTLMLPQALDYDLAIVDFSPKFVMLGTDFTPIVTVRNVGIQETSTFELNVQVPEFDYNHTVSISTPIDANEVMQVEFPHYTPLVAGSYVATATITQGGGENEANDEITISGLVSPLAEAYAINGVNLSYNEVNLSNGETVNVGAVDTYPWQMAEEFDGNYIYRINHDASFGHVDPDGTFHRLGIMTGVPGFPSGLAYNWETGVMYVVVQNEDTNYSHFCTLNMSTFELTEIAVNTSLILGMDFANDGYLYAVSYQNELIKFDTVTAEFSVVGPIGINILYPQDVSFDVETGLLYTIASGNYFSLFGTYDLETGAFDLITDMNGVYYYTLVITKNPNDFIPVYYNVFFDIQDEDGNPLENAIVTFDSTTNEPNNYAFYQIESGLYEYTVSLEGYVTYEGEIEIINQNVTVNVTMSTTRYDVFFEVVDEDGYPLENAIVTFDSITNEPNDYAFYQIENGLYEYTVSLDGYVTYEGEIEIINQNVTVNVTMSTARYDVFFEVVDEDGNPLENAVITLGETTNEPNIYVFNQIIPGVYGFSVALEGYITYEGEIELVNQNLSIPITLLTNNTSVGTHLTTVLKVFPNPASSFVSIVSNDIIYEVKFFDLMGNLVQKRAVGENTIQIRVESLPVGIYLLKINTINGMITKKIQVF